MVLLQITNYRQLRILPPSFSPSREREGEIKWGWVKFKSEASRCEKCVTDASDYLFFTRTRRPDFKPRLVVK
ncbi:hypothetical protein KJ590_02630, partial [Patescibacteria group bacterium]|nr:hypothetical protein [Patescibacteria group bacterium]